MLNIGRDAWISAGYPARWRASWLPGRALALGVAAGLIMVPGSASAADDDATPAQLALVMASAPDQDVQDIVVTANKRQENVQDVPYSVEALDGRTIESRGVRDAQDVANLIPNFNAQGSGRSGPRWYLRGIGDANPNDVSPLAIHLDDVYINYNGSTNFPLYDIERVEVLKGPQGTLWGRNTTAGTVNIIARKPDFGPANGYADVRYGNYNSSQAEGAYGGVIADDIVAGRVAFHFDDTDGYTTNRFDGKQVGAYTDFDGRASLLIRPEDDLDVLVQFHYDRLTNPGANNVIQLRTPNDRYTYRGQTVNLAPYASDPDLYNAAGRFNSELQFYGGMARVTKTFDHVTLTSISAVERTTNLALTDGTPIPVANIQSRTAVRDEQASEEVRLASDNSNPRYEWQTGVYYFVGRQVASLAGDQFAAPTIYRLTNYRLGTETYAVFANTRVTPLPETLENVHITLGARETRDKRTIDLRQYYGTGGTYSDTANYYNLGVYSNAPLAAAQNNSNTWDAFTYDVTPEWDVTEDIHAFVRFSKGFRGGYYNTNPTGANAAAIRASLSVIKPETLFDYEGGIKTQWFDKQLTANVAAFDYDLRNYYTNILSVQNGQAISTTTNVGNGYARGLEFELHEKPLAISGLSADQTFGLLDTRIEHSRIATLLNKQLVRSPHFSTTASVEYAYPVPGISGTVLFNTDWKYNTNFYYTIAAETPGFTQHGQIFGNGQIAYLDESGHWSLGLYAENLTNRRFPTTIIGSPVLAQVYQGPPRSFGGFLRAAF